MFSEELRILDRNTVKYMIEEQQREIEQQKEQIEKNEKRINRLAEQIEKNEKGISQLAEQINQLAEQAALLHKELEK